MALFGHPLLFFVLCLSICPRPGGSHLQQSWQLFRTDRGRPSLQNPRFQAFRAQNRHFCALLPFKTPIFGHFEHKIEVFVLGKKGIGIGKNKYGRSCKSPSTPLKCKVLITRQLTFEGVLDELKLCSPSTAIKYNYLCIRCLCFAGVLGDLHERRTHQVAALSGTQHLRPGQATASSGGDTEVA